MTQAQRKRFSGTHSSFKVEFESARSQRLATKGRCLL